MVGFGYHPEQHSDKTVSLLTKDSTFYSFSKYLLKMSVSVPSCLIITFCLIAEMQKLKFWLHPLTYMSRVT